LQVLRAQIWMSGPQLLSHMLDACIWIDHQCNLTLTHLITFHHMISFNQQSNFQLVNQNKKYLKVCLQRLTRRLVNNSGLVNLYRRRSSCLQYLKRIKFVCCFDFCYFDICQLANHSDYIIMIPSFLTFIVSWLPIFYSKTGV
jgi:hypothetical protein